MGSKSENFSLETHTADQKTDNEKKMHPERSKTRDSEELTADVLTNELDVKDLTTCVQAQVKEFSATDGIVMNHKPFRCISKFLRCQVCQKVVRTASFKLHMETHFGEIRFQCPECKKAFRLRASLYCHMRVHSKDNKYECGLCRQKFKTASRLKEHMQRAHFSETRYLCDVCGKRLLSGQCFRSHMRIHLRNRQTHLCDICGNSFTALSTLRVHKLIHSGTKPFKCSICEKSFGQRQQVTRHFRVHTGEKPYQCGTCNKSFTNPKGLKFHLNVHTGKNPINAKFVVEALQLRLTSVSIEKLIKSTM